MMRRIVFLTAMLSACAVTSAPADIIIGMHAPLTGFAAVDGKSARIATEIAIGKINAAGGLLGQKVQLQVFDDQGQGAQAVTIANKIVSDNAAILVIADSYSEPTRAAASIFQAAKMPYISAVASHPDITKVGNYVFRGSQLGEVQGGSTAVHIAKALKKSKVSIVTVDNDYGSSLLNGFKAAMGAQGVTLVGEYSFTMAERQFGSVVAGLRRDNADVIYIGGYWFQGGPLVSQIRAAGITTPIISSGLAAQQFIKIAGPAAEGVMIVDATGDDNANPEYPAFRAALRAQEAEANVFFSEIAHTAVDIAANAIRRAGSTDREKIRDALASTKDLRTMYGTLASYTSGREIIQRMPLSIVKDGKFAASGEMEIWLPAP